MKDAGTEAASITIWHWICSIESRAAGQTKIKKQESPENVDSEEILDR
jgi:hypothetical protein